MTQQDMNTINIKGKEYTPVSERIKFFNENYPNGSITTELVSAVDAENIVIKAVVTPDIKVPARIFTGYSQATVGDGYINKTSALENAETSAVGRALGMMGIGITDSVASSDEVVKATTTVKSTDPIDAFPDAPKDHFCSIHQKDLKNRGQGIWDHRAKLNDKHEYDENGDWYYCQSHGWKRSLMNK